MDRNRYELPDDVEHTARREVVDLLLSRFADRAAVADGIELSPPMAVVHLGLDTLVEDGGVEAAQQRSWRQLVSLEGEPVALAEVVIDESGGPRFTQLNYGQFVGSIANVISEPARRLDTFRGDVHILQIPALYLIALWYDGPDTDHVIPLAPAPQPYDAGREYPLSEFLDYARRLARRMDPTGPAVASGDDTDNSSGQPESRTT